MKRRIIFLVLISIFIFGVTACGKTINKKEEATPNKESVENNEQNTEQEDSNISYEYENNLGNLINGGRLTSDGEFLYYADSKGIYKFKYDGSEGIKLSDYAIADNSNSAYLNLYKNHIYFQFEGTICRANIDGSKAQAVGTGTKLKGSHYPPIYGMRIIGDYLYVKNNFRLYLGNLGDVLVKEKNPNGSGFKSEEEINKYTIPIGLEIERIHEENISPAHTVNITDGYIYSFDCEDGDRYKSGICRMKADGSEFERLSDADTTYMLVDGDWIYYLADGLYKLKVDGTEIYRIDDNRNMDSFNIKDGWIYYRVRDKRNPENNGIYKAKTDLTETQKLTSNVGFENHGGIYIIGDWIYYNMDEESHELWRIKTDGTNEGLFVKFDGDNVIAN